MPVTLTDYELTEAELRARVREFNPLDNLKGLIEKRVPIFVVQGDADKAVPSQENALILKERYEAGGAPITLKIIAGEGHQATPSVLRVPGVAGICAEAGGGKRSVGQINPDRRKYSA